MLSAVGEGRAILSWLTLLDEGAVGGAHQKMGADFPSGGQGHDAEEGPVSGLVVPPANYGALASGLMATESPAKRRLERRSDAVI